ncbi:MAG: aminopeptidase P family protein, partial [Clostridiales bacterium]|nr:aminopeptidase P family protein [Clostridiales bacterium]
AFEEIVKFIKPGITEKDIANRLKELLIELGGESLSFDPIVASGPNSSKPHYSEDSRVIEEKDLIILDYGCKYKGYCSDISRTVFVGEPTEEQKKVYEIVLKANMEAEKAVKEGVTAHEVDATAQKVIRENGYGEYILSRTGHGIGIAVHEAPYIRQGNDQVLKTGMAFSVEPGVYIAGKFGMRVEDIVVVDGSGVNVLNKAPKEMTIV